MIEIYDLESLADHEKVTYTNLRTIMFKLRKANPDVPLEWRGWKFFGKPGKVLYAYRSDEDVQIHLKEK